MAHVHSSVAVVVVESGATCPAWETQQGWTPCVLEQGEGEAPLQFADRVARYTEALDVAPALFLVVCNERTDAAAERARRHVLASARRAAATLGTFPAKLAVGERCSGTTRRSLTDLALEHELSSERDEAPTSRSLPVSIWFGAQMSLAAAAL